MTPLTAALLGRMIAGDEKDDIGAQPLPEAQRLELDIVVQQNTVVHTFKRGDPVRWKHVSGPVSPENRPKFVFVYWRPLDPSNPWDARRIASASDVMLRTLSDPDCIIANVQQGTTVFDLAQSSMLEPDPAPVEG